MPQVSVTIPLYNKGPYIRRALDSVLAQTFGDFECMVVDDGSTDDGPEIVKSYADPRVRLIQQANAGPGAARNRGVRETTAPYVTFLDADDEWLPEFLRVSMDALESHPECTVSVTSHYEGPSRKDLTPYFVRSGLYTGAWALSPDADVTALEHARGPFMVGAVVCRRDVFGKFGGFYERARVTCGEDTYLWLQLLVNCRVIMIPRALVWYHHEVSELGFRSTKAGVLQPYYSDCGLLQKNCPPQHRGVLDEYLARNAIRRISELCRHGDTKTAKQVLQAFPALRRAPWTYAKLRMKMLFPDTYRLLWRTRATFAAGRRRLLHARTHFCARERPAG